jgi:hypothetical protein
MRVLFLLMALLFVFNAKAAPGDTSWVNVHEKTQMTWYQRYTAKAQMPDGSKSYHKIIMYYRMGCANGGCSDWDYTTRVTVQHPTGALDSNVASIDTISTNPLVIDTTWNVFEVKEAYELARVITPYANGFANDWEHDFVYDVTDYYPLLKDSVEIEVFYQGWSSGFSATIDFAFIEGPRPREVLSIDNVYMGGGSYLNSTDFENTHLPQKTIAIDSATQGLDLKVNFSGHGFVNSLNCAEFCKKDYYVKVGGQQVASRSIWRNDCGMNAIWPQPGTWIYDRANWCPGDKSLFRHHDLSSYISGSTLDLDVDIESYSYTVPPNQSPASYNYSIQLIQYIPNHQNDVALDRILAPSDEDESARLNPVCGHAMVRIQNRGAQDLTSCVITYGIRGQAFHTYNWSGSLKHMESEAVWLPFGNEASEWYPATGNQFFEAYAGKPNGQNDENGLNGFALTAFEAAPVYPSKMTFNLMTNGAASETHWTLTDVNDSVWYSGDNLTNNTPYNIPFDLDPGCYVLSIKDRDKDGLSFFNNNDGGGLIRLIGDAGTNFFKNLQANFGTELRQEFTVGYSIGANEQQLTELQFDIYPNPATSEVILVLPRELKTASTVKVVDISGRTVLLREISTGEAQHLTLDISNLNPGSYLVELASRESKSSRKLIIQ